MIWTIEGVVVTVFLILFFLAIVVLGLTSDTKKWSRRMDDLRRIAEGKDDKGEW